MSKKEFLLPEELIISEMTLLIEQRRQKIAVADNATLPAAIDERGQLQLYRDVYRRFKN